MALGFMMIPAPTVASLGARSSTTTGSPTSVSWRASESPPIPPPTTMVERGIGGRRSGCQAEQGGHPLRVEHRSHRFAGGPLLESAGGVEDLRQEREIARGVEKDARHADHPVDCSIDVGLILERLVPRRVGLVRRGP